MGKGGIWLLHIHLGVECEYATPSILIIFGS
jgi:hypothetical protein